MSNVPDTTTKIRFNADQTAFDSTGVQWIINPWDELALTRALQLKEEAGGKIEKISVLNVGTKESEATIRKALAIGADDGIRIDAEAKDAYFVASQIANVAKEMDYDIILCGIDSSDYNGSMVGGMVSELLGMTSVSSVSQLGIENEQLVLKREIEGGKEALIAETPLVAVVQKGIAIEPRIPSMRGIMMARKKPLQVLQAADADSLTEIVGFEMPPAKAACKMIDEDNVEELIRLLHDEAKVL